MIRLALQDILKRKGLKAGLGYTVGNLLVKGIVFFTLPIFSRIMTTEQFGVYNIFIAYESILYVFIGLAMDNSVQRANIDFKNSVNQYISSISLIHILNALICCTLIALTSNYLVELLKLEKGILYLLVIYAFSSATISLYNMKVSLKYEYKKYLAITFSYSFGNILLSLFLMYSVFNDKRDYGRIIGATIAVFIVAVWVLYTFYKDSTPKINKNYWNYAIKFCLPLLPHGLSQVLLGQFDRIMIRNLIGDSFAGIYSLAINVRLVLSVITVSITSSWRTYFYDSLKANKTIEIQQRAQQITETYAILVVILMSVSPEIILIVGGINFEDAKYVIIPMIFDSFLTFVYSLIVQGEYYAKKTQYIMFATIFATVLNIITNLIFIPLFGFISAAYTTLFSYFIFLFLHLVISFKVIHFFIVPIKPLLFTTFIIFLDGLVNLIFIDHILPRILISMFVVTTASHHALKSYISTRNFVTSQ